MKDDRVIFCRGANIWFGKFRDKVMSEDISSALLTNCRDKNLVVLGYDMSDVIVYGNYINTDKGQAGRVVDSNGIAPTVTENHGVITGVVVKVGHLENGTGQHQSNTVYDVNGISPALTTIQGGTQQVKVLVGEDETQTTN